MSDNPDVVCATMRDVDGETHFECRFADGQKFAAITVDDIMGDDLKAKLLGVLNGTHVIMPIERSAAPCVETESPD